jgi:hypothetical protein
MSEGLYVIWSNYHRAWWRPNSAGYTTDIRGAGRYSRADALSIVAAARDGWRDPDQAPTELPVAMNDLPGDVFASMLSTPSQHRQDAE